MKCLGILGGMSWESTAHYYELINQGVKDALGGLHSADILMRSVDFAVIEQWQNKGDWQAAGDYLASCAAGLKKAGAEGLIIATNTMHKVAQTVVDKSGLELIHIADCTGDTLVEQGRKKVALLGTAFTMEQDFYKQRLIDRFDLDVVVPDEYERADIHRIIYQELCLGKVNESSRQRYIEIAQNLYEQGAEAIILGCTEIGMLLDDSVTTIPLVDTTIVHASYAVRWMLEPE